MTVDTNYLKVAEDYISLWNEREDALRRNMLVSNWTKEATYIDPMSMGEGPEGIDAVISGVQQRFPDFEFVLLGNPDGYGNCLRFSWGLGPRGGDNPIKGTDFVAIEGGRIRSVTGFLDQVPAGA